jgi:hypothetical protein
VSQRLDFHQRRMAHVLATIQDGARTTWEITETLFPSRSPLDIFLAVSEVIGHLDLLEMEDKILAKQVDGVIVWELASKQDSGTAR